MAIHPDDPPYGIFGLPRIITGQEAIERFLNLYDSEHNGITMCARIRMLLIRKMMSLP